MNFDFDPLPTSGDHREDRRSRCDDQHVMLRLAQVLLGRSLLRELSGEHEFRLEHIVPFDTAVEGRGHPPERRVPPLANYRST